MGTIIFYIIVAVIIYYSIIHVIKQDNHYKWFSNLKPGDRVKVKIYSVNCDCSANATVTNTPVLKNIEAKLDDDEYNRCKGCSLINSTNSKGEETCWYYLNTFNRGDITKLID
jgi:hypothetical protein